MFDFKPFKDKAKAIEEWLHGEFSNIRTGRATPVILESVQVDAYGSKMGIRELASITVEDPKTIRLEPWDKTQSKEIEKALVSSNLGVSVSVDDNGLRIIFPELTGERREEFVKIVGKKLEEARISVRTLRDKTQEEIEKKEKEGGMGEDDKFRLKSDLQKLVDETNKNLEAMADKKEKEIRG